MQDQQTQNLIQLIQTLDQQKLQIWDLHGQSMQNLDDLQQVEPYVIQLNLSLNSLQSLHLIPFFTNLQHLDISCNKLTQIDNLIIPNLKKLNCAQNFISDLQFISNLPELRILHIQYNKLTNINQLEPLKHSRLEELTLHDLTISPGYNYLPNTVIFSPEIAEFLLELPKTVINKRFNQLPKHIKELFGQAQIHIKQENVEYEGQGQMMYPHGLGKLQMQDISYEGDFQAGRKHGNGIEQGQGYQFKGQFKDGVISGQGIIKQPNLTYEGEFKSNQRSGKGVCLYADGSFYEGDFVNNQRAGKGTYYDTDGSTFVGDWKNDVANGFGKFVDEKGAISEGVWKDNEKVE
ncbi:Leucine_rich repeats and MORN repeat-containing protein [Hexamita inflata]|uniref:Leucine rich repeats and MORN repeat-containing protein n=1 Tax=Hexamita inflata TaxID=28002 RepID=A0AA86TUJ1_9EUKA|nr:Leucine rich repeats and MORN repeat-containing protein [Hexamita inflata]CAI9972557.1 Leucine rich repeats and MORN repeat-containing protein [Hexamita inflata]